MKYILYYFIVTICFIIYCEISLGGIIYRYNSKGVKTIQMNSCIHYLLHPFHNTYLWNYKILDVNYIFIIISSSIIYYLVKKIMYLIKQDTLNLKYNLK